MADLDELLAVLSLEPAGEGRFTAGSLDFFGGAVVFGGQLLAQSVIAGAQVDLSKEVKSIHTVFARGASTAAPLEFDVDVMQTGRTRSIVLLSAPDPDLIRHQDAMPEVGDPLDALASTHGSGFWEVRTVGGVDIADPDAVGPAELDVWTRFPDAPADPLTNQALLAFATDGFLIGTAMRPHAGVGQSMAHLSISTSVISHTLTFHEPVVASDWLLLSHESPAAGRGRSYGRAHVFGADGTLVASFVQENMIRDFPEGRAPAAGCAGAYWFDGNSGALIGTRFGRSEPLHNSSPAW